MCSQCRILKDLLCIFVLNRIVSKKPKKQAQVGGAYGE